MPRFNNYKPVADFLVNSFLRREDDGSVDIDIASTNLGFSGDSWVLSGPWGTMILHPSAVPAIAVGGGEWAVTDYTLFLRTVLLTIVGAHMGEVLKVHPGALRDLLRSATLRFMQGNTQGGALYGADGSCAISARWLPSTDRDSEQHRGGLPSDYFTSPTTRTLGVLYGTEGVEAENRNKAILTAVDPLFALTSVDSRSSVVALADSDFEFDDSIWKPRLRQSSVDERRVHSRPGTYTPPDGLGWDGSAVEAALTDGFVLSGLQVPAIFTRGGLLDRLVFEGADCWFRRSDTDLAIDGVTQADLDLLEYDFYRGRAAWLRKARGAKLSAGVVNALQCSPLWFTRATLSLKTSTRPINSSLIVTDDVKTACSLRAEDDFAMWLSGQPVGRRVSTFWFRNHPELSDLLGVIHG